MIRRLVITTLVMVWVVGIAIVVVAQAPASAPSVRTVDSVAELRALNPQPFSVRGNKATVRTLGYYEPGDGGGQEFYRSDPVGSDNGGTLIDSDWDGVQWHAASWDGNVKAFGAKGNGTLAWMRNIGETPYDDTPHIQAAVDYADAAQKELYFPIGIYLFTSSVTNKSISGVKMRGTGNNAYGIKQATNSSPVNGAILTRYHNGPFFTFLGAESNEEVASPNFFAHVQWGVQVRDLTFKDPQRPDILGNTNAAIVTRNSVMQRWTNVEFRALNGGCVFDSRLLDDSIFTNCRFTDTGISDEITPTFKLWRTTNPTGNFQYTGQHTLTWIACNWELNKNPAFDDPQLYEGTTQTGGAYLYNFTGCTFKGMKVGQSQPQRMARFFRVDQLHFTGTLFAYNPADHTNAGTLDAPLVFDACNVFGDIKIIKFNDPNNYVLLTNIVRFVNTQSPNIMPGGTIDITIADVGPSPGTPLLGDSLVYVDPLVAQKVTGAFRINYQTQNSDAFGGLPMVNGGGDDHVVDTFAQMRVLHPTIWQRVKTRGYYTPGDGGGSSYIATNSITGTNNYGGRISTRATGWSWQQEKPADVNVRTWGITEQADHNHTRLTSLLSHNPSKVWFPNGIYNFSGQAVATLNDISIIIDGRIIGPTNSAGPFLLFGPSGGFDGFAQQNVHVSGLGVLESIGMRFNNASNVVIDGLKFTGNQFQALRFHGAADVTVRNCEFFEITPNANAVHQSGILLSSDTAFANLSRRINVHRNTFRNIYGSAFRCNGYNNLSDGDRGVAGIHLSDNYIYGSYGNNTAACFLASYVADSITAERNTISKWHGPGINITHPQRATIRNNTIAECMNSNSGTAPLIISTTNNAAGAAWFDLAEIVGNSFSDSPGSVNIVNGKKVIFANNVVRDIATNSLYRASVTIRAFGDGVGGPDSTGMRWRVSNNDISGSSSRGLGFEYSDMPNFLGIPTILQNNVIYGFSSTLVDAVGSNVLSIVPDMPLEAFFDGIPRTLTMTNINGAAAIILKGVTPP